MNEPLTIATLLVLGITACTSYQGFKSRRFLDGLMFSPVHVLRDGQYYRLITSGFIHADWMHFFFNMFSLYSFGRYVELVFGWHVILLIYFSSILGGSLLSLCLHRHHDYRALGASGGVCGVIFAAIFLVPGGGVMIFPVPIPIPSWLYAILFIFISFFGMRSQAGHVGHDAHLGGALVGLLVATVIRPVIVVQSPVLYTAVFVITGCLFLYAYKRPLYLQTSKPSARGYWRKVLAGMRGRGEDRSRQSDEEAMDRLLDKVSRLGVESLSNAERGRLAEIAARRKALD
jgi:membrane associated rhomboid family serine protease